MSPRQDEKEVEVGVILVGLFYKYARLGLGFQLGPRIWLVNVTTKVGRLRN